MHSSIRLHAIRTVLASCAVVLAGPAVARAQKVHQLPTTPATVAWGFYWAGAKPALTVNSGDMIDIETIMTNSPAGLERMGAKPDDIPQWMRDLYAGVPQDQRGPGGHVLTGPIFVNGADSGDVLEVRMLSITLPIAYGYNGCSGYMREFCRAPGDSGAGRGGRGGGGGASRIIPMNREKMTAEVAPGITVPLKPFWGSIGVAPPAEKGKVNSNPPHQHAGNMDNKELVAGTTLYVPVWTKGALLELGDGHAAQGDGEVDQTAIETNLKGRIQVIVRKDLKFDWPRIETPTRADLTTLDRHRPKKGRNDDWTHPHDPDARITKMKDGRTHLAHKAEHAVDMETGAVVSVTVQGADQGDTTTVEETLTTAAEELEAVAAVTGDHTAVIVEAVLDKGYHSNRTLLDFAALDIRAYIAEPRRGRRRWTRQPAARDVVYANRRRIRGARGRALQRRRAERLERPNAHLYETGGMRRTHLRGHTNILKRLLIHAGGFNLGLFMRHRTGVGTPRSLQGRARRLAALLITLGTWLTTWARPPRDAAAHDARTPPLIPLGPAWAVDAPLATGC